MFQGIEGVNKAIKDTHTCRKRLPLGLFVDTMLRLCREWSLQDHSLLRSSRTEALNGQFGLKLRTEGYSWFCQHKQDRNFMKINKIQGYKTLLKDVAALWVVPSSNTKEDNFKIFAKKRFALRQDPSVATNFEEFVQIRSSCWIIEEKGGQYYCDCYFGIKGKLCKHTVGLMYKTKVLTETEDVRSVPLGQKRKPGRPKKEGRNFPHCLTTSPAPAPVPVSRYWRSPEVPENLSLSPPQAAQLPEVRQGQSATPRLSTALPSSPVLRREQRNVSIIASLSPIPSSSSSLSPDRGLLESPEIVPLEETLPAAVRKSRKKRRDISPSNIISSRRRK